MSIIFVVFENWGVGVGWERTGLEDLCPRLFLFVYLMLRSSLYSLFPAGKGLALVLRGPGSLGFAVPVTGLSFSSKSVTISGHPE